MIHFNQFLVLATLLVLIPGPDYLIVTKNTIHGGTRAGLQTILGIVSALFIHTTFAILGLSALLVKSATLYALLKYIGAVYLLYLGINTFLTKTAPNKSTESKEKNTYLQGLMTNLLNPKVAIFFLTFLPQFVTIDTKSWLPFGILGMTYIGLTLFLYSLYVLFLGKLKETLKTPRIQKGISYFSGILFIGFGIKLLLDK